MQGIEVRIRSEQYPSSESLPLGTVSSDELDRRPSLLEMWGIQADGYDRTSVVGEFVVDRRKGRAYFELIVVGEEE